jgi:predicted DNA-binding transcriptional regulator AlpA
MTDKLLTEKQAAPIVGMSRAWLQRKRWEGGGPPYVKYDRAVRYRMEDLLAWVEAHAGRNSTSQGGV